MWGKINLYKESNMSSQQAVSRLRRLLKIKKIGHSGTLDPMATGVLNCFVSQATKFIDLLPEGEKIYRADFILGKTSDTLDIWGELISHSFIPPSEAEVVEKLGSFLGPSLQTPPMYSALKHKGKALYKYAREGVEIPRKKREIHISNLELLGFDGEEGSIRIHCSRGTYIRTLIDDFGQLLGTGALMSGLVREKNDWARIEDCYTLQDIEGLIAQKDWGFLQSVDRNVDLVSIDIPINIYDDLLTGKTKTILKGQGEGRVLLYYKDLFVGTAFWKEDELQREKLIQVEHDT